MRTHQFIEPGRDPVEDAALILDDVPAHVRPGAGMDRPGLADQVDHLRRVLPRDLDQDAVGAAVEHIDPPIATGIAEGENRAFAEAREAAEAGLSSLIEGVELTERELHKTLETLDDVTIYTFLYPILAPDSSVKSRDIWCSSDPARAWNDWMIRGKTPASKSCDTPTEQVLALGKRLMVRGTPTMFFDDGSRVSGAMPLDQFQARLDGKR